MEWPRERERKTTMCHTNIKCVAKWANVVDICAYICFSYWNDHVATSAVRYLSLCERSRARSLWFQLQTTINETTTKTAIESTISETERERDRENNVTWNHSGKSMFWISHKHCSSVTVQQMRSTEIRLLKQRWEQYHLLEALFCVYIRRQTTKCMIESARVSASYEINFC